MTIRKHAVWTTAAVVAQFAVTGAAFAAETAADSAVPEITPVGITVAALGYTREADGIVRFNKLIGGGTVRGTNYTFATAAGMTLYTYDKDTEVGKSNCDAVCSVVWPVAAPAANAKPTGDWSIIVREGGAKQWAYRSKPVYTHAKDQQSGENHGSGADNVWRVLTVKPPETGVIPYGITVQDIPDAGGHVLVDNEGKTLYSYSGKAGQEPATARWIPFAAPALANPVGEFSLVDRGDGTVQWVHRGRPLYKYAGDLMAGDVNGSAVDKRWRPALMVKYPMPAQVVLQSSPDGKILTTSDGKSIYRHDIYGRPESNDGARGGIYQPAMGRAMGTKSCEAECLKTWRPLPVAKGAQQSWRWTILTREDGTKQWAYNGYALYTYIGDKKSGDTLGANTWDIGTNDQDLKAVSLLAKLGVDYGSTSAFFWTPAHP